MWISVSSDLYDDAKRDLNDLNLSNYTSKQCHLINSFPYGPLSSHMKESNGEGLLFSTYSGLIASTSRVTKKTKV